MKIPFDVESINTEADVKEFFTWLIKNQKLNFHPDTPFEDYYEESRRVYSNKRAKELNDIMDKCCLIADVYKIGNVIFKEVENNQTKLFINVDSHFPEWQTYEVYKDGKKVLHTTLWLEVLTILDGELPCPQVVQRS